MKPAAGMMVTRHVRLVEPIGEGAMGAVWLAEHLTLHTRVAVKLISEELAKDYPDVIARFRQEASASAQIKSPYVVQVFDHGLVDGKAPYIVMELLEGESLAERLERTEAVNMRQTAQVLVQVGKALDRAHQLGIIHRDIKPDNIFLSTAEDGLICKVLDFGIAKQTKLADQKGVTLPGTTVGTPEFMSREQVMTAEEVTPAADRWALAVVAYQCLTGELPFDGETLGMVCVAICKGQWIPPSELHQDLPPAVDAWFERALDKDCSRRFESCKEMALAFTQIVPKHEIAEPLSQSGEFSLPPPTSDEAKQVGKLSPLGGQALLGVTGQSPSDRAAPSSDEPRGRRHDRTPTFSGAAAELAPGAAKKRSWRRRVVGAIGAVALLAAGVTGGVLVTSGARSTDESAASGSDLGAASESTDPGNHESLANVPVDTQTDPGAALQDSPDASSTSDADAGPPRYRRPSADYPYERSKRPQKDLGF